ncbi:MAG: PilZ domain-containing protein [Gammaproteobacteria bacterium]|nr:PilZ domain-containing protein [Gammaproteobacteria bacterium]
MEIQSQLTDHQPSGADARFLADDTFQVKILFSSDDPKALGKTFSCSLQDLSKSAIQISSEQPLTVKSVLDLSISLKDSRQKFFVTGDINSCKPGSGVAHTIGIQLKNRSGTPTDLENWKTLLKNIK